MSDENASPRLPRQLVICCDGTNNNLTGGTKDTNVVKTCELLQRRADPQRVLFYDPGVGNPGELPGATTWDTITRHAERIAGLAFGRGVYENMAECYLFLMKHYRPGDQIFVFGFSRGAFTARSVAGLVNQFGILMPHMESMLPTLLHTYFADRGDSEAQRKRIASQTTTLFANDQSRYVEIEFVGVWDTVASVGMWPFGAKFTAIPTIADKRFVHVRQALALDEQRAQFMPRLYVDNNGDYKTTRGTRATMKQLWFRGSHCDVGGGYAVGQTAVSDASLAWLVSEAWQCGLELGTPGADREQTIFAEIAMTTPIGKTVVHSELHNTCLWALTGMTVRTTNTVELDDRPAQPIQPVEHPSVAQVTPTLAANSVWQLKRPKKWLYVCLALLTSLMFVVGYMHTQQTFTGNEWRDLIELPKHLPEYLRQNWAFAKWQLFWLAELSPPVGYTAFRSPRWSLVWDLALIASYAYVLAWFAAPAFARLAGLRRADQPVAKQLQLLGWALPLAVFSDVGENIATWITITLARNDMLVVSMLAGLVMTALAVAKIVGWLATLYLIVMGTLSKTNKP